MSRFAPRRRGRWRATARGIDRRRCRSYMRVRELYRALPPAAEDPEAVAVIIGNRSYDKLPAQRDLV